MSATPGTSRNHAVRSGGFTLVELLAVMLILGILMALVLGASKLIFKDVYVEETKSNMAVIMTAIKAYRKATGSYPSQSGWVGQLAGNAESKKFIAKLGENVWKTTSTGEFLDAWGNAIKYSPTGGLAGAPGLTSAGPDGDHGTEEDNVRHNK